MEISDLTAGSTYLFKEGYGSPFEATILSISKTSVKLKYENGVSEWKLRHDLRWWKLLEELPKKLIL